MFGRAWILSHATAVGLTCTAATIVPPASVYHAAKARFAKPAEHHRSTGKQQGHSKPAAAAPVCPPSGIAAIAALPSLSRPLVVMDEDYEDAVLSGSTVQSAARSPWGGAVQASAISFVRPGGAGGVGTVPPAAGTPVAPPTDKPPVTALPEPKTWLFMLAGFALTGAVMRGRHDRRAQGVA